MGMRPEEAGSAWNEHILTCAGMRNIRNAENEFWAFLRRDIFGEKEFADPNGRKLCVPKLYNSPLMAVSQSSRYFVTALLTSSSTSASLCRSYPFSIVTNIIFRNFSSFAAIISIVRQTLVQLLRSFARSSIRRLQWNLIICNHLIISWQIASVFSAQSPLSRIVSVAWFIQPRAV